MATNATKTKWFGMKVTPEQKEKIKKLAKQRGTNQKEAIMQLVEEAVREELIRAKSGSFLDRNRDLCGIYSGPGDLSTNPKYMEGYGPACSLP